MFHHVVLLEFHDPNSMEQIEFMREQTEFLGREISEVVHIEFKKNLADRGREFTHAIIASFESSQKHDAYQVHPAHLLVKERIKDTIKSLLVLDYEAI